MRGTRSVLIVGGVLLLAALSACAAPRTTIVHDTRTVTASPVPSATATAVPAPTSAASGTPSAGTPPVPAADGGTRWRGSTRTAGCADDGRAVPSGARSVPIADVDGDGRPDALVIDDRTAEVGVLTHSGHLSMTRALWGPGPGSHSVAAAYLSDGITALLSDDGRTAFLGYYVDCGIVQPKGVDGEPYRFALFGWGRYGALSDAGVRCTALPGSGGQHTLSGVALVRERSLFRIRTTVVSTADRGVTAENGRVSTTPGAYGADDPTTERAKTVDCAPRVTAPSE
ncbi:FG-GAP repeat domain-containing protein [Amnibacterium kyonggiense]